ncbi:MAG: hypothetical protein ABL999_17875 [Pyrinomonadaceae bacterium]
MYLRKIAAFFLTMALQSSFAFSQAAPVPLSAEARAEKAKKDKEIQESIVTMLDRTIAEIGGLKLPGNRAVVYGLAGDIYWRYDSKRSRELFRNGASEIIIYQAEADKERVESAAAGIPEMFDPGDPRYEFLNQVGIRDPELGLELMSQTRSPALAEAMALNAQQAAAQAANGGAATGTGGIGSSIPPPAPGAFSFSRERAQAFQEVALEQQLTLRAAQSDPDKAAKAIKDSLAKGISTNVIPLLQTILQKDEKRAADLTADVISKLTSTDLTRSNEDLNGALGLLQTAARPPATVPPGVKIKFFSFNESQAREIALKLANTLLQPSPPTFVTAAIARALPSIEKLAPEKAILLKQKTAKPASVTVSASAPTPGQPARQWNPAGTPEEIISAANKIANAREKTTAYQSAAGKIGQIADEARARRIIDSIPDEKIRAQAQNTFDANRINRMTVEGRLEEARAIVSTLSNRRTQIQRLVALAMQFQRKNSEKDRETAGVLMTEAKNLTNQYPEDEDELGDYMEIIRGYALVEPDAAFRMIEPFMEQFNDMVQASATLSRYNKRDRTFKKGEMVMRINGGGSSLLAFRYVPQIQLLAQADLDRMNALCDRFQRSDARTLMKLYILQGYQRTPMNVRPSGM